MTDLPTWHFPPRGWGLDVIQDLSNAHFRDAPIPKLVREVLQNSLDANDTNLAGPVDVEITECAVDAELIGRDQLKRHIEECLSRTNREKRARVRSLYEQAMRTLEAQSISCLKMVDSGTLGLQGSSWDALVLQEGSVQKPGEAPGGSNGVGKNAVLNVSDLRTVFYSTRYVLSREGRVEKFQGKATLMDHPDPDDETNNVQHVGFFSLPEGKPVLTTQIPDFFRLPEVGTGVFVMGFNPRSANWVDEVTSAVIENFFYAVHHKTLVVRVKDLADNSVLINHETLDSLFAKHSDQQPAHYYYKATRDLESTQTPPIGKIGPLNVYVSIGSGPRRTAYINRNGMLITDSREQKINPIAPRGKSLWPDYGTIVAPATSRGDEWIRQMESTSHDAMSPRQCFEGKELRDAENWLRQTRAAVSKIIDDAAQVEKYGDTSNLNELATMFPDEFDTEAPGNRLLPTETSNPRMSHGLAVTLNEASGEDTGEDQSSQQSQEREKEDADEERKKRNQQSNQSEGKDQGSGSNRGRRPRLTRPRLVTTGSRAATIAFTPAGEPQQTMKIALTPAGSEWGQESPVQIVGARVVSPQGQRVDVADGSITLTPQSPDRIVIEITTSDPINESAFRIG